MDFRDRVVVVTGASSGIGRVTADAFARRGAIVVPVARREDRLAELVAELREHSPRSAHLAGDLGERGFAEHVVAETLERHGRLDVLVNNAALSKHKHVFHTGAAEAERVMAVNFSAAVWTTLAALPAMLRQGEGWLVYVSSMAGRVTPPRESVYAASKAALTAFAQGLASDLAGSGIHPACIVVGAIDTGIWDKLDEPSPFRGRKAPPRVVADAILDAVERRRHEVLVPRRLDLALASFLRVALPGLLRRGLRRMDPVPPDLVERARARARGLAPGPAGPRAR